MEIRLEQIAKSFDKRQVIRPTTLTIQNGSFTTLLRMIAGLETPAQTQPAETITTPTEEAPAAEEPAAAEEAPALSGKVTVYMPSPAGLADKLAAAFTEKTGVEVELFQGTTGEILATLEAEQANPLPDVVILASWSDGLSMKADGQLESYTPRQCR